VSISLTLPMMIYLPHLPTDLADFPVKQIDLPSQACPPEFGVWITRPFERPQDLPHHSFPRRLNRLNIVRHPAPPNFQKSQGR
jgi:hypothetical protein